MEVAPRYWQRPSILSQFWVSTSGGQASGSETTQLSAGSVTGGSPLTVATPSAASIPPVAPTLSSAAASAANPTSALASNAVALASNAVPSALTDHDRRQRRQPSTAAASAAANNAVRTAAQSTITSTANGSASSASPVSTTAETMTPLPAYSQYCPGRDAARGQSSEPVRGDDDLVQSRARQVAQRCDGRVPARGAGDPPAVRPDRGLRRRRARISKSRSAPSSFWSSRRSLRSTSFSGSCTKASSIRSRF